MGTIKLSNGFSPISEGTHIFQITEVVNKEDFGKLEITMMTQEGEKHIERFSLLSSNGTPNQGAYNAFSYFAKTAMNDFTLTEIDPEDLVGHFIECDVEHEEVESRNKPGKTNTFARLTDKRPSEGWDVPTNAPAPAENKASMNLMDILG